MANISFVLIYLIAFILVPQDSTCQDISDISIGKKYSIHSAILNEERGYWVYLPDSYNDKIISPQKYPVLVLLDGDFFFHSVTGVVKLLSSNTQIPEMIVVGVLNTDRVRDMTPVQSWEGRDEKERDQLKNAGGADNFLRFIHEELLRKIDSSYRTMLYKGLAGHSLAGALAIHSFMSEKKNFNFYISMDPSLWFADRNLVKEMKAKSNTKRNYESNLYISAADNRFIFKESKQYTKAIMNFYSELKSSPNPPLISKLDYFKDEDHNTVPLPSLHHGLRFLFKDYPLPDLYNQEVSVIKEHYENISSKYGFKVLPPEQLINQLGYHHLYTTKDINKSIKFFAFNIELYPESFNVYDSQAEAYNVNGNKKEAIEFYKKSIKLNPNNTTAIQIVKDLEGK